MDSFCGGILSLCTGPKVETASFDLDELLAEEVDITKNKRNIEEKQDKKDAVVVDRYIFFDCDDCMYRNNWATADKITAAIAAYTAPLGVSKERSFALYQKHGTCLKGMLAEGIMPFSQVEDFLEKAHTIDYSDIVPDPTLVDLIAQCGTRDRRFVFTASIEEHASRCLAKVLAPLTAEDLFSAIVDTRVCDLETKHHETSFRKAMKAANVPPSEEGKCILLDDSVTNIKKAKAMGWTTVLVGKTVRGTDAPLLTPTEADHHIGSLHELREAMPELFPVLATSASRPLLV